MIDYVRRVTCLLACVMFWQVRVKLNGGMLAALALADVTFAGFYASEGTLSLTSA